MTWSPAAEAFVDAVSAGEGETGSGPSQRDQSRAGGNAHTSVRLDGASSSFLAGDIVVSCRGIGRNIEAVVETGASSIKPIQPGAADREKPAASGPLRAMAALMAGRTSS